MVKFESFAIDFCIIRLLILAFKGDTIALSKSALKDPIIYPVKYDINTATELNDQIRNQFSDDENKQSLLIDYPTVYIIDDPEKVNQYTVYVGETNDIQRRTIQHLDADPKEREDFFKLKNAKDVKMYVIGHEHFNKSMTLDVENRLMQYLSSVPAVKKLNNRRHNEQNKYYDSQEFNDLFDKIWKKLGKQDPKLFPAKKILESSALFKVSPFNKLTDEQLRAKTEIIDKINQALVEQRNKNVENGQLILVEGDAGSGKTVLMSNIFYDLVHEDQLNDKEEPDSHKKLSVSMLVNQDEQLKVYADISRKLFEKDDKVTVEKPVSFIKHVQPDEKVDIALIDEAHLLLTQSSQSYSNDKRYPDVKVGTNMLKDIVKRAKVVMAVFDPKQVLSTSAVWTGNKFKELEKSIGEKNIIHLHNQMRIDASPQTVKWIRDLVDKGIVGKIPKDPTYEIKIFKSPAEMQKAIEKKDKDHNNGISRMVATFDWDYSGGKRKLPKGQDYWEVSENGWKMPWNKEINTRDKFERRHHSKNHVKYSDLSWAEKDYTIDEIGSTYTVQGFDLNYVGVELGPSVKYRNRKIVHDPSESKNSKATQKRNSTESYADELLKNEFNVLMTRGVHGLYIHAVDPELQAALEKAAE
ncbi:ATP-dependent exonuclease [Lactobacillus amylovorus]|uniref:ATP-dependent exonuclease n=1 Tax=Lactobacillus amylovorus TaxID=1604 RepID=A0A5B8EDK7_LACAM|nr:ATP-dependent exonuclease [Lactobacillus amylovorus]